MATSVEGSATGVDSECAPLSKPAATEAKDARTKEVSPMAAGAHQENAECTPKKQTQCAENETTVKQGVSSNDNSPVGMKLQSTVVKEALDSSLHPQNSQGTTTSPICESQNQEAGGSESAEEKVPLVTRQASPTGKGVQGSPTGKENEKCGTPRSKENHVMHQIENLGKRTMDTVRHSLATVTRSPRTSPKKTTKATDEPKSENVNPDNDQVYLHPHTESSLQETPLHKSKSLLSKVSDFVSGYKQVTKSKSTVNGDSSRHTKPPSARRPDMAALFKEINDGGTTLSGSLTHLTPEEKQRRREEAKQRGSRVPGNTGCKSTYSSNKKHEDKTGTTLPPVFKLESNRDWIIENYYNHEEWLKIAEGNMKQSLAVHNSDGCRIEIVPKLNCITIENCRNIQLLASSLISSIEIIRCEKIKVQVSGKCPCYHVDSTDGCTIYLSRDGKNCSIATSKTSEINVAFPSDDADDLIVVPIPEQYEHAIQNNTIVSKVSSLYGDSSQPICP